MNKQQLYRKAVEFVALNDGAGDGADPKECSELVTAVLISEVFDVPSAKVGKDIANFRKTETWPAPRVTLRTVNNMLSIRGIKTRLHKGRDYFYFAGDEVERAPSTMVIARTLNQLTQEQWYAEYTRIAAEARKAV